MIAARLLRSETIVDLSRAAHLLSTSLPTIERWTRRGLRGVRIESAYSRQLGVFVTSEEALGRFLEAVGWETA